MVNDKTLGEDLVKHAKEVAKKVTEAVFENLESEMMNCFVTISMMEFMRHVSMQINAPEFPREYSGIDFQKAVSRACRRMSDEIDEVHGVIKAEKH